MDKANQGLTMRRLPASARPLSDRRQPLATLSSVTFPVRARVAGGAVRRLAIVLAGVIGAVLVTASCAAGQHAQTAQVVPAIDGTHGQLGNMYLEGVALHAPTGPSYAAGSNVQLAITLVNAGSNADTLLDVTSADFTGWSIVDNAQAASVSQTSGDTGLPIEPHAAQRLGLADLGASAALSPRTLVLEDLSSKVAPLFPGTTVDVTFRFANAGTTTLHVPVQLTATPNSASLPAPTGPSVD